MDYIKSDESALQRDQVQMEESLLFPTAVYHLKSGNMPQAVNREALVDFILKRRKIDPKGRTKSNRNGWQSADLVQDSLKSPDIIKLWDTVIDCTKAIATKQSLAPFYQFTIGTSWANINLAHNQYNVAHCHPGTYYAAVYYAQAEEGHGALVVNDPRPAAAFSLPHSETEDIKYNQPSINIEPVQGDMILMPGWLFHSVLGNETETDKERIVVASNVVIA